MNFTFTCLTTRSGVCYKTKIKDIHELREGIVVEWDKLDKHIIDKALESGKKNFKILWLHEEDSLNIKMWTFLIADILLCVIFVR